LSFVFCILYSFLSTCYFPSFSSTSHDLSHCRRKLTDNRNFHVSAILTVFLFERNCNALILFPGADGVAGVAGDGVAGDGVAGDGVAEDGVVGFD
jgi:hypothetical protein